MTGLLVSVRSAAEAAVALRAGVDLLDVKEPARGPLGKSDERVIEEVVRCAAGRVPVSAALGELRDVSKPREASDISVLPPGIAYGKLGLAGCACWPDWSKRWAAALERLPGGVTPVAVAYADWRSCGAPPPDEVVTLGARLACGAALLDTYEKNGAGLFAYCDRGEVAEWIGAARSLGMLTVLAGSLTRGTAAEAAELNPDYLAVRGAACRGGRAGELDIEQILALRRVMAGARPVLDTARK